MRTSLICMLLWSVHASAGMDYYRARTSDDFELSRLQLDWQQFHSDISWPYADEPAQGSGFGLCAVSYIVESDFSDLSAKQFWITYLHKFSEKFVMQVGVGIDQHQKDIYLRGEEHASGIGFLSTKTRISENAVMGIEFRRDYLYHQVLSIAPDVRDIFAKSVLPSIQWAIGPKIRAAYRGKYHWLDDYNEKHSTDFEVLYGVMTPEPWLWIGLGGEYAIHRRNSPSYYSPTYFRSFGPRFQYSQELTKQWSVHAGGSVHAFNEEDGPKSRGHYLVGGLQWGARDSTNLRLTYEDIQSEQSGKHWSSSALGLVGMIYF